MTNYNDLNAGDRVRVTRGCCSISTGDEGTVRVDPGATAGYDKQFVSDSGRQEHWIMNQARSNSGLEVDKITPEIVRGGRYRLLPNATWSGGQSRIKESLRSGMPVVTVQDTGSGTHPFIRAELPEGGYTESLVDPQFLVPLGTETTTTTRTPVVGDLIKLGDDRYCIDEGEGDYFQVTEISPRANVTDRLYIRSIRTGQAGLIIPVDKVTLPEVLRRSEVAPNLGETFYAKIVYEDGNWARGVRDDFGGSDVIVADETQGNLFDGNSRVFDEWVRIDGDATASAPAPIEVGGNYRLLPDAYVMRDGDGSSTPRGYVSEDWKCGFPSVEVERASTWEGMGNWRIKRPDGLTQIVHESYLVPLGQAATVAAAPVRTPYTGAQTGDLYDVFVVGNEIEFTVSATIVDGCFVVGCKSPAVEDVLPMLQSLERDEDTPDTVEITVRAIVEDLGAWTGHRIKIGDSTTIAQGELSEYGSEYKLISTMVTPSAPEPEPEPVQDVTLTVTPEELAVLRTVIGRSNGSGNYDAGALYRKLNEPVVSRNYRVTANLSPYSIDTSPVERPVF